MVVVGNMAVAGIFTGAMWAVQVLLFQEPNPTLYQYSIMFWVMLIYMKLRDK